MTTPSRPRSGVLAAMALMLGLGAPITFAGERLELTRLTPRGRGVLVAFVAIAVTVVTGALVAVLHDLVIGTRVFGVAWVALAMWLGRFDIARKTIRQQGLPRYVAYCLLSGYAWLAAGGALLAYYGQLIFGPRYDAALLACFGDPGLLALKELSPIPVVGMAEGSRLGTTVSTAGDTDNDGYDDLIAGAPGTGSGAVSARPRTRRRHRT